MRTIFESGSGQDQTTNCNFFCIFVKVYNNRIKCKLFKSWTKWTGLFTKVDHFELLTLATLQQFVKLIIDSTRYRSGQGLPSRRDGEPPPHPQILAKLEAKTVPSKFKCPFSKVDFYWYFEAARPKNDKSLSGSFHFSFFVF